MLKNSRISKGDFGGSPSDMHPTDTDWELSQAITLAVVVVVVFFHDTVIELELVL